MQIRLRRFLEDRTRLLAAIGHDLRTPITSLRLRTEFISDSETREKFNATLDEMQGMAEAALSFAKTESSTEPTRTVELNALLESICDDLADMGWDVKFRSDGRLPYSCRPAALRRAIRNVIENAIRYGERARVEISTAEEGVDICVEDDGPGIPPEEQERVCQPFVRMESSRNRDTGGVGLGLSIARSIIRNHGGDIEFSRSETGFRTHLRLPETPSEAKVSPL
jgi:signal transduction histidine kinase